MTDAKRRGLRTALQLIATLLTTGGVTGLLHLFGVDVTAEQYATVSAVLLPLVTVVLNGLEDAGTIPALLKAPASDGADPIPPDDGVGEARLVALYACGAFLGLLAFYLLARNVTWV